MAMTEHRASLGDQLRSLRLRSRWTLREMSARSGIPLSTLSKVERDELSLSYDKLSQLAERLQIDIADLFATRRGSAVANARRSVDRSPDSSRVNSGNCDYHYLCADLRQKRMTPMLMRIRADGGSPAQMSGQAGEEYVYVLEGCVRVHTEFYEPVVLNKGESMYIDSSMGHAYTAGEGCNEAAILRVCAESKSNGLPLISDR
jgi:transcriptional regulator with XRE-family HTH domain